MECDECRALIVTAFAIWRAQNPGDIRGQHLCPRRRASVRHRKARPTDEMSLAMELFQDENESGAVRQCERLLQFEDRLVRFTDARMNAPGGLLVAVEGMLDGPAVLIEIGGR